VAALKAGLLKEKYKLDPVYSRAIADEPKRMKTENLKIAEVLKEMQTEKLKTDGSLSLAADSPQKMVSKMEAVTEDRLLEPQAKSVNVSDAKCNSDKISMPSECTAKPTLQQHPASAAALVKPSKVFKSAAKDLPSKSDTKAVAALKAGLLKEKYKFDPVYSMAIADEPKRMKTENLKIAEVLKEMQTEKLNICLSLAADSTQKMISKDFILAPSIVTDCSVSAGDKGDQTTAFTPDQYAAAASTYVSTKSAKKYAAAASTYVSTKSAKKNAQVMITVNRKASSKAPKTKSKKTQPISSSESLTPEEKLEKVRAYRCASTAKHRAKKKEYLAHLLKGIDFFRSQLGMPPREKDPPKSKSRAGTIRQEYNPPPEQMIYMTPAEISEWKRIVSVCILFVNVTLCMF
jgi:hypothetical protein